jgi:hypothetical protein
MNFIFVFYFFIKTSVIYIFFILLVTNYEEILLKFNDSSLSLSYPDLYFLVVYN